MSNHVTSSLRIHAPDPIPPAHDISPKENGRDSGAGEPDHNETMKEGMHL